MNMFKKIWSELVYTFGSDAAVDKLFGAEALQRGVDVDYGTTRVMAVVETAKPKQARKTSVKRIKKAA